jgi:dTMP kinase
VSSPEVRGAGAHPSPYPTAPVQDHDVREVLRIAPFRRLWISLSLSSLGDWLGLLALTALAPRLAHNSYAAENLAVAAVFILRLAPAVVIGPLAGVIADRLDRRLTMVVTDVARFALFLSIPLVGTLTWLFVATFLIEVASLIWIPAKEASVPNLVPRERLETANQLSLFTTYGSAPVAAALFAGLALLTGILDNALPQITPVDLALYVNAATFLVSGLTILRLAIPNPRTGSEKRVGIWRTLVEGWQYVAGNRLVRGLVVGMLGAFAAGGAVIGLARTFVTDLGGGDPGYGLLFGTVFLGLALGMFLGPRLLPDFSRRRLFGLAIGGAGLALAALALFPNLVVAVIITLVIGAFAGVAWVTGYTLLGLEVADELRGRTFAFVQTMVRVVLVLVLAVAPLLAAAIGMHHIEVTDAMTLTYNGAAFVFLAAGLLAAGLGVASYRHMDDRHGVSLSSDLVSAFNSEPVGLRANGPREGFFLALEGGEGAGKSTQAASLRAWLESLGHDVVTTFEPGGTDVGRRLRSVLLDHPEPSQDLPGGVASPALSPRAEALLFAADRAEHVASVVRPALELGHVVITDRYADSSVAYQGAGRDLAGPEVARLSRWATDGLQPHLTVLLDLPAAEGLARVQAPDRLESEPLAFHEKVRERFLELARRGGSRYLVVDARRPPEQITAQIRDRLAPMLPLSAQQLAEAEAARLAEEETRRVAEQARRLEEARARATAEEQARREAAEAEERVRLAAAEAAALSEVRRQQEELAAAERARQASISQAETQRAREEHARQRALHAEERRRHREAGHPERDARSHRGAPAYDDVSEPDPATRPMSLVDELFGGGDEDSLFGGDQQDRTVQLPRVDQRPDERR